jgi:hypothetical protein
VGIATVIIKLRKLCAGKPCRRLRLRDAGIVGFRRRRGFARRDLLFFLDDAGAQAAIDVKSGARR